MELGLILLSKMGFFLMLSSHSELMLTLLNK